MKISQIPDRIEIATEEGLTSQWTAFTGSSNIWVNGREVNLENNKVTIDEEYKIQPKK